VTNDKRVEEIRERLAKKAGPVKNDDMAFLLSELDRARKAVAACHGLDLFYIAETLRDSNHMNTADAVESASRYVDAAYDAPTENK
jgi:hypothetical protein